jgi:hypothetical protein
MSANSCETCLLSIVASPKRICSRSNWRTSGITPTRGRWLFLTAWVRASSWQRLPAFDLVAQLLSRHRDGLLAYRHVKVLFVTVEAINGNIRSMLTSGTWLPRHEYLLFAVQQATAARRLLRNAA